MSGSLDIQLDQHVLVVANAGGFHLVENLSRTISAVRSASPISQNALAFTAAAADRLEAHPVLRDNRRAILQHSFGEGLTQLSTVYRSMPLS